MIRAPFFGVGFFLREPTTQKSVNGYHRVPLGYYGKQTLGTARNVRIHKLQNKLDSTVR